MKETNKRAVIYTRVSSREQVEEGGSLATQERLCRDYAIKNGFTIVEHFEEQGESAKTALRSELQRMLDYCTKRTNKITVVLTYKLDRIARNTDDYSYIRILLKRYGVEIKSITEYFENTPAGRFMENIIVNVGQFDNDMRAERTKNGMEEAIRDGRYAFLAPLGYSNSRIGGKANIVPNDLADVVRKTFLEVAKYNASLEDIRLKMIKEGLTNKTGKPIPKSQFYRLLRNEAYSGWINKYGGRYRGTYEAIISEQTFELVQQVLKRRTRRNFTYVKENPDFPLRRFATNGNGEKMTGCWSQGRNRKYPYYRLKRRGFVINRDKLEDKFLNYFEKFAFNFEQYKNIKKFLKEEFINKTGDNRKQAKLYGKQIENLKLRQQNVIDKNYSGVINDRALKQQLEMIDNEIIKIEENLVKLNCHENLDLDKHVDKALEFLKAPKNAWLKAPFIQRVKLQWFAFPQGIVFSDNEVQTNEEAFVFKAKEVFSASLSQNGSFMYQSLNRKPEIINLKDIQSKILIKNDILRLINIIDN